MAEATAESSLRKAKSVVDAGDGETGELDAGAGAKLTYLSPIASPLLEGKALRRSLKLIQLAADIERAARSQKKSGEATEKKKKKGKNAKMLHRGVHEVTKCVRNGEQGVVFFASDVFPIEIIAHLPVLCEEKDVVYAYLCGKKTLGHAFRSRRPASVIMITPGPAAEAAAKEGEESFQELYKKVVKVVRKNNPYF